MNKYFETLKVLFATPAFRRNIAQVAIVAVTAVTGAIIANKFDTIPTVEIIENNEAK